jgi:hypothetical protein
MCRYRTLAEVGDIAPYLVIGAALLDRLQLVLRLVNYPRCHFWCSASPRIGNPKPPVEVVPPRPSKEEGMADTDPHDLSDPSESRGVTQAVTYGAAFGVIVGSVVSAITQNPVWIGIGIPFGAALGTVFGAVFPKAGQ